MTGKEGTCPKQNLDSDAGPFPRWVTPSWEKGLNLDQHCGEHRGGPPMGWLFMHWADKPMFMSEKEVLDRGSLESWAGHWKPRRTKTLKLLRHGKTWPMATTLRSDFKTALLYLPNPLQTWSLLSFFFSHVRPLHCLSIISVKKCLWTFLQPRYIICSVKGKG